MEEAKVGTQETKEALEALKLLVIAGKHIKVGGVAAIPGELLAIAPKYKVFADAYTGAEHIKAELMDLDKTEIIDLFVSIFDGVKEVEKA